MSGAGFDPAVTHAYAPCSERIGGVFQHMLRYDYFFLAVACPRPHGVGKLHNMQARLDTGYGVVIPIPRRLSFEHPRPTDSSITQSACPSTPLHVRCEDMSFNAAGFPPQHPWLPGRNVSPPGRRVNSANRLRKYVT